MDWQRYSRQIALVGQEAQEKLAAAKVLIVGAGGLGVPAALYLNGMGIGQLGLIDSDVVEHSNLHRQVAYTEADVGKPKVAVLKDRLKARNTHTEINTYPCMLEAASVMSVIAEYDLVIDATDNFPTRYLIDDACYLSGKPWIYAGLQGFEGQLSVFNFKDGPTYRCVFPNPPSELEIPDCNTHGILGVLPGILGSLQALEAVKLLLGNTVLSGKLLLYDGISQHLQHIQIKRNPHVLRPKSIRAENYLYWECATGKGRIRIDEIDLADTDLFKLQWVDVRSLEEFKTDHIKGARNLPLDSLEQRLDELDKNKPLYLYCQKGPRSLKAYNLIVKMNAFPEVYWLENGFEAFKIKAF